MARPGGRIYGGLVPCGKTLPARVQTLIRLQTSLPPAEEALMITYGRERLDGKISEISNHRGDFNVI